MALPNATRPCAFVFLRSGSRALVSEMFDPTHGTFYRPPGGGIEFGEHSRDTVIRELREEFDIELDRDDPALLGVIENAFRFRGEAHHEICFIYQALVRPDVLDALDGIAVNDLVAGDVEIARVVAISELLGVSPLYPDGVRDLLATEVEDETSPPV